MLSLVIPVYNNEDNLPRLFRELEALGPRLGDSLEVVFVVDGSPDRSLQVLESQLPDWRLRSRLIELSRNFGSFAAIAAGLRAGTGDWFAVIAADLQEPPELVLEFHRLLHAGEADVVFGCRTGRADPWLSRVLSASFWHLYRRFVVREMPRGGIDVFGCTRLVRDRLLEMPEVHTNLVALVLWLGFRRVFVPYERRVRLEGRSGWTVASKLRYAIDSVFGFTDLPIRALLILGSLGMLSALAASVTVFVAWWMGGIPVLGYTPLMLVISFFGGLTALGLGIVGQYAWLALQNARGRPSSIIRSARTFDGANHGQEDAVSARMAGRGAQARTADRNSS